MVPETIPPIKALHFIFYPPFFLWQFFHSFTLLFNKLFPSIDVKPDYYVGTFYRGTNDGLPMIGQYDDFPNCLFLYAYGDNGLVYSGALAKVLRDVITKGTHPLMNLYSQRRINL
jgi:glycine/D-amino acid oxidase-like deaminating enzyme